MRKELLAVAFIIGCNGSLPIYTQVKGPPHQATKVISVQIDPAFDSWEVEQITTAVSEWNTSLNGNYYMVVNRGTAFNSSEDGISLIKANSTSGMILEANQLHTGAITFPSGSKAPSALIYLDSKVLDGRLHNTTLHEIGHAFRAEHMDGTLMQITYLGISCVDQATVIQVAREMRLDPSTMNYCK